ncbi:MAG: Holliday junction resolvase RuvX [Acidimicrobiales bacterium]
MTGRPARGKKAIAFDLGERRIGVAVSDSGGVLASPYGVVERTGDEAADHRAIASLVEEVAASVAVVGLPVSLSGAEGPAARRARTEASAIARLLEVPVVTFDERLTTVQAVRMRQERGENANRRESRPSRARNRIGREGIDAEAAAVLLQAFIESGRP